MNSQKMTRPVLADFSLSQLKGKQQEATSD